MIVAELEIEDYKQFAGLHRFGPVEAGIVGVIGANGVGKTTLFEAIEWCLYQPREITAEEVRPRSRSSTPRVKLTLQDPATEIRYVVERVLKKAGANAELYREDEPETRIVHGSRQVTEYVARSLIGLSHRAFVSTFFTRQKELTFFGNLRDTERRREVGRLLGFETIREAQRKIGHDRTAADNEARVLLAQHTEQSEGRDFLAEAAEAEQAVAQRQTALEEAEACLAAASEAMVTARDDLTRQRELERKDADLRQVLERVAGDERAAAARRDGARRVLAELDQAAAQRAELEPVAAGADGYAAAVEQHEAARERFVQRQRLEQDRARIDKAIAAVGRDLRRTVAETKATGVDGWSLAAPEAADPVAACARLIGVAEGVDTARAVQEAASLATCFKLAQARDKAEQTFRTGDQRLGELKQRQSELMADGDPRDAVEAANRSREAALQEKQAALTNAQNATRTRDELAPIAKGLESRKFEDHCPTCGRPFAEHEVGITLAVLHDRLDELTETIARLGKQGADAERRAARSEQARSAAEQRLRDLATLNGRIEHGTQFVDDAREVLEAAVRDCEQALAKHGLDGVPEAARVEEAQTRAEVLGRIAGALATLHRYQENGRQQVDELETVVRALAELGEVVYDPAVHEEANRALQRARTAAGQIAQVDQDLARRPEREADLAAAKEDLGRLAEERTRLDASRAEIGFDPVALAAAVATEEGALRAERAALAARNSAEGAFKELRLALQSLMTEQQRIAGLLDRSAARQREADLLDQMYREFTLFDQYVAGVVTPQLAGHTGELLGAVTEGKYDHVAFDENYGIKVFDGDEGFPMEEFSGGERDVIALCARLALSRMIGDQAVNPPGFLVLDEVFGSLDRDRRTQVLETLGALSGTAEAFHQLFIISHVDDVRYSPVFSEVWRVSETSEGVSRLENLNLTGGAEEG